VALGVVVTLVARVAQCTRHRQTGNRHRLASSRRPTILDVAFAAERDDDFVVLDSIFFVNSLTVNRHRDEAGRSTRLFRMVPRMVRRGFQ
jgi:hypothetical protein